MLLKLVIVAMLTAVLFTTQQYGYYIALRWVVCSISAHFAYRSYLQKRTEGLVFYIVTAVLFNPLLVVRMPKSSWHVLDAIIGTIILLSILFEFNTEKMENNNKRGSVYTPKELRYRKINRALFLVVLIVIGAHIICAINTTYNGHSLEQIGGKKYIDEGTIIQYFGLIPIWVSNIFYAIYVTYGILLVYGVTGLIGAPLKKAVKGDD